MELQNRGVSLDEIYGLSKILDLDKLGKEWHYVMAMGRSATSVIVRPGRITHAVVETQKIGGISDSSKAR